MSKLFNWAAAHIVAAFAFALPLAAMAEVQMTNPVTGELESYTNAFVGASLEWNSADNWDTGNTPFISGNYGNYDPALVTGTVVTTATAIDGWTLRVGAYNGATVYWSGGITKIQAGTTGCWLTADETSAIEIKSFAGNQLEGSDSAPFKLSSASNGGITWVGGITNASNTTLPFWYYLKGSGTVAYGGDITVANAQVIKQADIALSGTSQVASKTLVTFGSGTTKTFSADATIKRLTSLDEDLSDDAHLATITSGATTLTTADAVGTCELVQTSTAIVLYWVDGDPAALTPTVYKPSININFTHSGNGLTTLADVGLGGYAVPGTSWNNLAGTNGSLADLNAVDSTGATSATGASVTISNARGSYSCGSLTAASDLRYGYIDESTSGTTPTVTISSIPYEKYHVIVYTATDAETKTFGYLTINGTDYTYVNDELTEGTTAWGNSGAQNTAEAIEEGVNVLVSPELRGSTVTVVGHRNGDGTRGCIAAIQIVEVPYEVGANDLEIALSGDRTYTVEEDKVLSGTVYLTGNGTLTLDGEGTITAGTIDVGADVVLNVNSDRLDGTTFVGAGVVVYDGVVPPAGRGWTASAWTGTVWLKNKSGITGNDVAATSVKPNSLGNAKSKVKFSGVSGWVEAPVEYNPEIVLENAGYDYALQLTDGSSPNSLNNGANANRATIIKKLSGSGTLCCGGTSSAVPNLKVYDASGFTGSINTENATGAGNTGLVVVFCDEGTTLPGTLVDMFITSGRKRTIYVASGKTVTLDSAATWTAATGFGVEGKLVANGTMASAANTAVYGAGNVVFTGRAPTVSGDAWWKNEAWTGTVTVKSVTDLIGLSGTGTYIDFNEYGNTGSVIELDTVTGWLNPDYTCNVPLKITGTLSLTNGYSGKSNAFKVGTLLGSGTIAASGSAPFAVFQVTDDWSGFTGAIQLTNSKVVAFGSEIPSTIADNNTDAGTIYIAAGADVEIKSSSSWWSSGVGFVVDGTVKASARSKWGDGTAMTIGDNGVLELVTGSSSVNDTAVNYSNVTGTGTVRYSGTNWRTLPDGANMFATTLSIELENNTGVVFNGGSDGSTGTIGSLFGTKNLRNDLGGYSKVLTVKQAKDGVWEGAFLGGNDRLDTFIVDPGASTTGTLTLAGAHTHTNSLTVNGSVNLTGTWVGATTVAGTIGGTGTLTGDLTFSSGSTFKAYATDDADGLVVSGTVTCPGEGKVTVDVSAIASKTGVALLTADGLDADNFTLTGASDGASLEVVEDVLTLVLPPVTITVPEIANTTVTVAIDGTTIGTAAGNYNVDAGSVVTVTYVAADGYEISGLAEYTIDTSKSETTFDPSETTHVAQCVAYVVFQQESEQSLVTNYYTTVSNAIDAASAQKKTVVLVAQPDVADTYAISVGEVIRVNKNGYEFAGIVFPQGAEYNNQESVISSITMYSCALYTAIITKPDSTQEASSVAIATLLQAIYANYANYGAETTIRVLDGTEEIQNDNYDYNSETHTYTLKTMVAYYDNGYTKTYYPTLSNAVATVNSGLTITLAENVTLTESVEVAAGKSITIDLNGKTITGPADGYAFSNAGEVTIENGTITGAGGVAENTAGGASIAVSSGSYTTTSDLFGNVEGGTIAVSGGTFSQSVADEYLANGYEVKDNGDGTYGVRESFGWIYEAADHPNYTGSWSNEVSYSEGKIKIDDGNTYMANRPSDGQLVTVAMTLSFDDANDEDEDVGDAKAAVRLASGETSGTYQFQLYTSDGVNKVWTNATVGVTATKELDYTFVFVLDLTNKTYTASIVDGGTTNAMTVGGATDILFAYQGDVTPVQKIEFIGAGSVTSIEGSYEDAPAPAEEFVNGDEFGAVTLDTAQAAWLNGQNNYAALADKIATMSQDAFNKAYLLNLDITDPAYDGTFTFEVSDIDVGDTTVSVKVTLTRSGEFDGPIIGTLKLTGTDELGNAFEVKDSATITDAHFSAGDGEVTITFPKDANTKFFQPVIE